PTRRSSDLASSAPGRAVVPRGDHLGRGRRRGPDVSAAAPTVGVLALQGDIAGHLRHLERAGARAVAVRRPGELREVNGLVLPGGESTAMSRLLDADGTQGPVAERLGDGLPVYGSCAGMILLASLVLDTRPDAGWFSAIDMTVRRNAFGRQVDSFETDLAIPP